MFFGNSRAKDEEILLLKKEIEDLKSNKIKEDYLLEEINDALKKVEKGLFDLTIKGDCSNSKINNIKNTFNEALSNNSYLANESIEALIEYGNANFEFPINTQKLSGKMGSIVLGIRSLGSSISEILALLDVTSDELNKEMIELSSASNSLSDSSNSQAASLEETAAALEEVTATIISNSENAIKMSDLSSEVSSSAQNGQKLANETFASMDGINEEVTAIDNAIVVIDQISFQTNILSLNAAVEAATAGEAGKGFAVVAQEVRNLANRSADAAKEIKELVVNAKVKANDGKEIATNMIEGYKVLNENIKNQEDIINNVSSASKEQQQAIEQINDAVTELDKTTQQNASAASQISSQAKHIQSLSESLVDVVSHTKYDKQAKEQICDIDMVFTLNSLKLDHINFKDNNFSQLDTKRTWKVTNDNECKLGKWISQQERESKEFTRTSNWSKLKEVHKKVHEEVQSIVDDNANGNIDKMLNNTPNIDQYISEIFWTIQQTKKDNCKNNSEPKVATQTKIQTKVKETFVAPTVKKEIKRTVTTVKPIVPSNDNDEWASF